MTQQIQVVKWFLLSSLLLSVCLPSAPPLATIYNINSRGRQREQTVKEGENVGGRERLLDQDKGREVNVVLLSRLNNPKWRDTDRGDGSDLLKRGHSPPMPLLQQPTMPVRGKVDIKENTDSRVTPAFTTSATATKNTNTATTTITTTTMPHPVVPTPLPLSSSSSSCSSLACKWVSSPHFIVVISMTVAWLVAVTVLYWITRTARGTQFLEALSSLFACDKKDQEEDQVLAKGIGYFDGSPGLRRFVLIEDDEDEEEEEDKDDLFASEFKDVRNKEDEEMEGEGSGENIVSPKWKPPRKGTYILQEASKEGVLEVGTYRLQEDDDDDDDEEEEVVGKRKRRKENKEEEVEYILEGATYILQSERVGRRGIGEAYGQIGGIEGLYGVVGREQQGYRRIEGLDNVYRMMGRGEGRGRYRRIGGIEGLYGLLQEGETERREEEYKKPVEVGRGRRGEEDGVILSVSELEGAVGGTEHVREESTRGRRRGEEGGRQGGYGGKQREDGVREMKRRSLEERRERGGRRTDEREREDREVGYALGERRGAARANLGRVWDEGTWRHTLHSPHPQKRAASFPMDHFLSHLMPRKLSLIVEEENH